MCLVLIVIGVPISVRELCIIAGSGRRCHEGRVVIAVVYMSKIVDC
jgi:hypothetical protein